MRLSLEQIVDTIGYGDFRFFAACLSALPA